ncbi:hypothetical protein ACFE04_029726 [Oxalis oulophora]
MADSQIKSVVPLLMVLNFCMYVVIAGIGAWSMNRAINHGFIIDVGYKLPANFSPIYFPMGNAATGFFVTFSLIAAVVGVGSILAGFIEWSTSVAEHSMAASTVSAGAIAWSLTVLAAGLACKEIQKVNRNAKLRIMEAVVLILSVTQLLYILAVHSMSLKSRQRALNNNNRQW